MVVEMIETATSTYLGRFAVYGAALLVASLLGTQADSGASKPTVIDAALVAALSLGPALVIVSTAHLRPRAVAIVAGAGALGMLTMWWLSASSSSSTAGLVFLMGWWIGIPLAIVVSLVAGVRPSNPDRSGCDH